MASPNNDLKSSVSIDQIDKMEKPQNTVHLDKFGAATEKSPEEIALVRKLDLYMMVNQSSSHIERSFTHSD